MEQILGWLVGGVGEPLIQWLKVRFAVEGKTAMWLTAAVSMVLGVVLLLITEELALSELNFENVAIAFSQILSSATLVYKLILKKE